MASGHKMKDSYQSLKTIMYFAKKLQPAEIAVDTGEL